MTSTSSDAPRIAALVAAAAFVLLPSLISRPMPAFSRPFFGAVVLVALLLPMLGERTAADRT